MNIQSTTPATPLRQRMIEDMRGRNLGRQSQSNHLSSCARFAAFLGRGPETATADDVRRLKLFLVESGTSIVHRNRIMTGVKFLLRVTLRRHDLAAEIYHLKEPQKVPLVLSRDEVRRLLAVAPNFKLRAMLSLAYGCGLRAGEVVRLADIAYQNKRLVYDLLMRASAETTLTIAADPRHLGARIGITSVLHTWGSAMTHHPHVHMIVPGGGLSPDGERWIACRKTFFLPVRVLSRLFRRLFLDGLARLHRDGRLAFFGDHAGLADRATFDAFLAPLRNTEWVVYAKEPFAGPKAVLAYLARYTHRVAISNSRLIHIGADGITFRVKDYRVDGPGRYKTMTLEPHEFIRRFLMHVLPRGQHRIRHYGLFANGNRAANIARTRELLAAPTPAPDAEAAETADGPRILALPCPCCGGRLIIVDAFGPGGPSHHRPAPEAIDSS